MLLTSFSCPLLFLSQIYFSFLAIEFEMVDALFMIGDKKSSQLAVILAFFLLPEGLLFLYNILFGDW